MMIRFALLCTIWAAAGSALAETPATETLKDRALEVARSDLQEWIELDYLIFAIKEQNALHAGLTEARIAALDARWIGEGRGGAGRWPPIC